MPSIRKELPVIDFRRCTGCGDCLRICPTQCLVTVNEIPVVTTANACIRCEACALVCPTQAVFWMLPQI
jgi:formate hydrogenlyase subunit 6/NADH:ubiquinone oxidoreductase subunit I